MAITISGLTAGTKTEIIISSGKFDLQNSQK